MVVHDDDDFRKALIKSLDRKHFTVTFRPDGDEAVRILRERSFRVVLLGLGLRGRKGMTALEYVRANRAAVHAGVIIIGEPSPELRGYAREADETLLKPVDPDYVAERARTYCT